VDSPLHHHRGGADAQLTARGAFPARQDSYQLGNAPPPAIYDDPSDFLYDLTGLHRYQDMVQGQVSGRCLDLMQNMIQNHVSSKGLDLSQDIVQGQVSGKYVEMPYRLVRYGPTPGS